jgi:voltage-gated potassium channel
MSNEKNILTHLDLVTFALSIYVLLALLAETFFALETEIVMILDIADFAICLIFLFDFAVRFHKAESKLNFMRWGWIDLISSIPLIGFLRVGRAFRIFRVVRLMRAMRSLKNVSKFIFKNRAKGTLTTVSVLTILLVITSSISILQFEIDPNSNIKTAEDALWWSYTTITTVGYGDKFPVTTEGRILAAVLMTAGVGLFGTFTAYVASLFMQKE